MQPAVDLSLLPPAFRAGITGQLAACGVGESDSGIAVLPLLDASDCERVEATTGSGRVVVALVRPLDASTVSHALTHGCATAVGWDDAPRTLAEALSAAARGLSLLPVEVLRAMPNAPMHHRPSAILSEPESRWLQALARGVTVVRLADDEGYSERAMFRRLHDLYSRLGAAGRAEAILAAQRLGLLDG